MTKSRKTKRWLAVGRFMSVMLMVFALLFLTTANYFVSALADSAQVSLPEKSADSNEDLPKAPNSTEEKTTSGSLSIIEEYLHKNHFDFDLFNSSERFLHQIAVSQKIELVHFKLLSPPPEV